MANRKWGNANQRKRASETVYDILYRNIINLNLVPGTPMSEKEISEKMSVSRTPVREAFIKLSNEALVSIIPQKGSFVSRINLARVKEERFLRESLETSIIDEIILNYDISPRIDELHINLKKQEQALEKNKLVDFIELDDFFHGYLFEIAEKLMCYELIMNFSSHYRRVRFLSMSVSGVSTSNLCHHKEILTAIEARDREAAERTIRKHLRKLDIEKDMICEQFPDYFDKDAEQTIPHLFNEARFIHALEK